MYENGLKIALNTTCSKGLNKKAYLSLRLCYFEVESKPFSCSQIRCYVAIYAMSRYAERSHEVKKKITPNILSLGHLYINL